MTGLFLLLLIGAWIAILLLIVFRVIKYVKPKVLAVIVSAVFSVFFMCLPVYDEIIGGHQFRELCISGTVLKIDEENAKNRKVFLRDSLDKDLDGYLVPIRFHDWDYLDVDTKESVLSWKTFTAKGGWLMRLLGISENSSPLIFNGNCYVQDAYYDVFKKLNITDIDRR